MEKLKLSLGFLLLPLAFALFVMDRIIFTLMPQQEHKNFSDWLNNSNVAFALARVLILITLRWVFYWMFKI